MLYIRNKIEPEKKHFKYFFVILDTMSSLALNRSFKSPLDYISKLVGNSFEKFLTRNLNDVRDNMLKIQDLEAEHLEKLNQYKDLKIDDLDSFENEIKSYGEISELFAMLSERIVASKSSLDREDQFYNDLILLHNEIQKLSEMLKKVTDKMNAIHDKILTKSSESISSGVLKDLWKDEEELWDDFYLKSQTT